MYGGRIVCIVEYFFVMRKGITLFSGEKWLYTYTLGISEVGGFHYDS